MFTKRKKKTQEDEPQGAPEWMVTFSDCMTLLLTFFVLLLSYSTFEEQIIPTLQDSFETSLPNISLRTRKPKDSVVQLLKVVDEPQTDEGSERKDTRKPNEPGRKRQTAFLDYNKYKVFIWRSDEMFWAKGNTLSNAGRERLATMASFLNNLSGRVVISENGDWGGSEELGLSRSWQVFRFLTDEGGIAKDRLSITGRSMLKKQALTAAATEGRKLEITILERGVCQ